MSRSNSLHSQRSKASDGDDAQSRPDDGSYAIITPDDLHGDESDSDDDDRSQCGSPFYGVQGALSPW